MQEQLKYLFTAEFEDGYFIDQDPDDKSVLEPESRSGFYDVMEVIKDGRKLNKFSLTDGIDIYAVDLLNGNFEINTLPIRVIETALNVPYPSEFKIIYFRQVTRQFNADLGSMNVNVVYQLGWQGTLPDGSNIQRIIEFM